MIFMEILKRIVALGLFFLLCVLTIRAQTSKIKTMLEASLELAANQYFRMSNSLPDSLFPRAVDRNGNLVSNRSAWWTSGFFPASLWYLSGHTRNAELREKAILKSKAVEKEKLNISDHDIGFKIYCPFGNAFKITGDSTLLPVIVTAARSLIQRFNPKVGLIRSWGEINDTKEYIVIIDNMMNLELLFAATRITGDSAFYRVAVSQADRTIEQHFRPDGSSYHLVVYNPTTGEVQTKRTAQGYSDSSAWARGQAWGLYGYTVCYRETGHTRYLEQAKRIATFLLTHPNLPADKIPYWDFDAPGIPATYRDASAAAIMASSLLELSDYCMGVEKSRYRQEATEILKTLSSPLYRTSLNEVHNFLLKHSVGHLPAGSEVDTPLSYADYYYIEAMLRWLDRMNQD
jgi:unsaturated chondroitin disaccharide hydrolase